MLSAMIFNEPINSNWHLLTWYRFLIHLHLLIEDFTQQIVNEGALRIRHGVIGMPTMGYIDIGLGIATHKGHLRLNLILWP